MADPDDGASRKELTREKALLADLEIERDRIARRKELVSPVGLAPTTRGS